MAADLDRQVVAPPQPRTRWMASLHIVSVGFGAARLASSAFDTRWSTLGAPEHGLAILLVEGDLDFAARAGVDPRQPRSGLKVSARPLDLQFLHREIPALRALGCATWRCSGASGKEKQRQRDQTQPRKSVVHRSNAYSGLTYLRNAMEVLVVPLAPSTSNQNLLPSGSGFGTSK